MKLKTLKDLQKDCEWKLDTYIKLRAEAIKLIKNLQSKDSIYPIILQAVPERMKGKIAKDKWNDSYSNALFQHQRGGTEMKPMNFNFVGKLPILLAKKPFTTIRKATEEVFERYDNEYDENSSSKKIITKEPKWKEGDIVPVVWKKNKDEEWFCRKHGASIVTKYSNIEPKFFINSIEARNFRFGNKCNCTPSNKYESMDRECFDRLFFNKNLGNVNITKVEEIEVGRNGTVNGVHFYYINQDNWQTCNGDTFLKKLAKKEGFSSDDEMFKYLESYLNGLDTPKKCYLYRCEWV